MKRSIPLAIRLAGSKPKQTFSFVSRNGTRPAPPIIQLNEQRDICNIPDFLRLLTGLINKVESISESVEYIKSRYTISTTKKIKKSDVKNDKVESIMAKLINKNR